MSSIEDPGSARDATDLARHEIVVGVDDSPSAAAALSWAAEQSRLTGAPLRVVHAWQMSAAGSAAVASGAAEYVEAAAADARARATRMVLDTLGGTSAEIRWTLDVVEGAPGPALVSRAYRAELLVVGTREHRGLRRAVVGSVSHYCISHAEPPVVAVPAAVGAAPPPPARSGGITATPGPLL